MKETHIQAGFRLQQEQVMRSAEVLRNTAKLSRTMPNPTAASELMELAQSAADRSREMQASWMQDWAGWLEFAGSIQGANTVPKYMDRLNNIFLQADAQRASQLQEFSELVENINVSYAHWLSRQVLDD